MTAENQKIYNILSSVTDPEIPVITIKDLGIIRDVLVHQSGLIEVFITPTYSGCPAMEMIAVNIKAALQEAGYNEVKVTTVLSPPWTTDWISEEGMRKLKDYGIAPPVEKTSDKSFITGQRKVVPCPFCESHETELLSQFGSTPCKSLYRCTSCLEPFDYFKCH